MNPSAVFVGSDPEVLLINQKGEFIPSCGLFGGTKTNPLQISKNISIQEDNVSVEYNTTPCNTINFWTKQHTEALKLIQEKAISHKLTITTETSASYAPENLSDPRAWLFGCEPDFNVWSLSINPKPTASDEYLRCAGGHVHIGIPGLSKKRKIILGRLADLFLGVPLSKYDKDLKRKELYGKAGAIRFKPYGIEYRTLSSFWIHNPKLKEYVFYASQKLGSLATKENITSLELWLNSLETSIFQAINHQNQEQIHALCVHFTSTLGPPTKDFHSLFLQ